MEAFVVKILPSLFIFGLILSGVVTEGRENKNGINRQGEHATYRGQNRYERGHLVPAGTYSSSQRRYDSTYTYTNSVPQRPRFNSGTWNVFERYIRVYAEHTCTQPSRGRRAQQPGTLYLLTGTSLAKIQQYRNHPPQANVAAQVNRIGDIVIPNSLWTAGCCIRPSGQNTQSFAVIGNNVQDTARMLTQQVTVAHLQTILTADVTNEGVGANVVLFPGKAACSNDRNNVKLPWAQRGHY